MVNIYSAPVGLRMQRPGEGTRLLATRTLDGDTHPCIVAGDFNAHHRLWSTAGSSERTTAAGRLLAKWIEGARGERDSAIDLVLLSSAFEAQGWTNTSAVRGDLTTGSDHMLIITAVSRRRGALAAEDDSRPLNMKRTDWSKFDEVLRSRTTAVETTMQQVDVSEVENVRQSRLDTAFEALQSAMRDALESSTPRCKSSAKGCEWWDSPCDKAVSALRLAEVDLVQARAEETGERVARRRERLARKAFERQVRASKRAFFDDRINALEGNAIFGAMKWSDGGSRRYRTPPLVGPD
ncbi:hypothetical protein V8E36_002250 [Tilletia maclaganii]